MSYASWRAARVLSIGLVIVALPLQLAADGNLASMRREVRVPAPRPASPPSRDPAPEPEHSHSHHHHSSGYSSDPFEDDDDGTLLLLAGIAVITVASSPIWAPMSMTADDNSDDGYFARYPYRHGQPGHMMFDDEDGFPTSPRDWSSRVSLEYGTDFDDISRTGGRFLLSTVSRFDMDVEWNAYREDLVGGGVDEVFTGDANLVFRFAQNKYMQWRTGLGIAWFDDGAGTDTGFNFTYGADFFPCRPLVVSGAIDWGTLGEEERFHGRITAGVLLERVEFFVGYDFLKVGSTEIEGPTIGMQVWF
jgi:hypothetical protein